MVCSSNWCKTTTYQILVVAPSVDNLKKSKTFWARAWVLFWLSGPATWDSQQWWIDNWNPIFEKWNWESSSDLTICCYVNLRLVIMFDYIVKQWSNQDGLTKYKLEHIWDPWQPLQTVGGFYKLILNKRFIFLCKIEDEHRWVYFQVIFNLTKNSLYVWCCFLDSISCCQKEIFRRLGVAPSVDNLKSL